MKYLLVIILLSGGILGCSQHVNAPVADLAELQQQFTKIQEFIDSGNCTNASGCSFIAVGKKPCGGPGGYLAFSTSIDVEVLEQMVKAYTEAEEAYQDRTGASSDCSIVPDPKVLGCEDGKCVIIE